METTPPASTGTPKPPPRKRRRPAVVCSECRRRKIACDRKVPCGQCALHKTECVYRNDIVHSKAPAQHPRPSPAATSAAGNAGGSSGVSAGPSPPVSFLELIASGEPSHRWPPDTTLYHHKGSRNDDEASATEPDSASVTIGYPMMRQEGRLAKSRFFGPSHWMNSLDQYVQLHRLAYMALGDSKSELFITLRKCKALAQAIKADEKRAIQNPESDFFIPPRDVADALVDIYLDSFESIHRILHIPTFRREYQSYWIDPASANDFFKHKLLLVLALGSLFYDGPEELKASVRLAATQAVYKSGAWLCTPQDKHHISLGLLQVYCLVLIARHSMAVDLPHDLDYISTGSLLHTAFNMGFSRDPSGFVGLPIFLIEMRRRLWATILELYLQSSMDLGLYPMVSLDDTNCKPPSNLDDDELHENMSTMPAHADQDSHFTQTTLQRILASTYPLRLQIAKRVNGFGRALSYEEVLQISRELTAAIRSNTALLQSFGKIVTPPGASRPSEFGVAVMDILTRRFLLSLHSPFARRSSTNVELYYSRSVSVEISLKLLTHFPADSLSDPHRPPVHPYLRQLWLKGRGLWKSVFSDAISTVCFELIQQLEDDPASPLSLSQREILGYVRSAVEVTRRRVENGETNVKGYTFFAAGLAHVDAVLAGEPVEGRVISEAIRTMNESYEMLKAMAHRRGVAIPGGAAPEPAAPEDVIVTGSSLLDGNSGAAAATAAGAPSTINIHELGAALDPPQQAPPDQWMEFYDVDFENPPISWFFPEVNMTMAESNEGNTGAD